MSGISITGTGFALTFLLLCAGCSQDMWNGSRLKPLSTSPFFADGRSSRPLEPGTVARGTLAQDYLHPPLPANGVETDTLPFPLTRAALDRGQERFTMYCAECHGYTGYGNGIVVKRGYPPPPSYHTDRLRNAPLGHFYDVMTHGYGIMYPYNDRVQPADRWAIAAYIRALQLSQNARPADIPASAQAGMTTSPMSAAPNQAPANDTVPGASLPGELLNGDVNGDRR
jgi:mono/diheme cytochrome c family protein